MRLPRGALQVLRQLLATNKNVVGYSATLKEKEVPGKSTTQRVIKILRRQQTKDASGSFLATYT